MNIHLHQVEKKPQVFSLALAAVMVLTVWVLLLTLNWQPDLHFPVSSTPGQAGYTQSSNGPVAVPAPLAPARGQVQVTMTPTRTPNADAQPVAIAVPVPDLP